MYRKTVSGILLILFIVVTLASAIKIQKVRSQSDTVELFYDDGSAEEGSLNTYWLECVKFDHPHPGSLYRIEGVKIYIVPWDPPGPLKLFIYVYQPSTGWPEYKKLLGNLLVNLPTTGWNSVNLTSYNIIVDQDFLVAVKWVRNDAPFIGRDHDTSGHYGSLLPLNGDPATDRAGFYLYSGLNEMIRALVSPDRSINLRPV